MARRAERKRGLELGVRMWHEMYYERVLDWVLDMRSEGQAASRNGDERVAGKALLDMLLKDPRTIIYVIVSKEEPIGMIGVIYTNPLDRSAEMVLSVDEEYRGLGIGRTLGVKVIESMFANGFEKLVVHCGSQESINLSSRLGFREVPLQVVRMELQAEAQGDG